MSFAGRTDLLDLVDQLVTVGGGPLVAPGTARPALVIEGSGGSGRTEILREVGERWARRALIAEVDPRVLPKADASAPRPLIAAVLLGFWCGTVTPGFEKVSFDRVVLAHIAMSQPVRSTDPKLAVDEMRGRLNAYRSRGAVLELVGGLLSAGLKAVGRPVGAGELTEVMAEAAARGIVDRLTTSRWASRVGWNAALEWFGHQDQRLRHDPVRVLVQLSRQIAIANASVREDVDDLLVAALLADLRDGMSRVANRPSNAIILLDNGDTPQASAFVTSLVRVRQNLAAHAAAAPDPLTVVVTSGGELSSVLAGWTPRQFRVTEAGLAGLTAAQLTQAGPWLAVVLGDLSFEDVQQLVNEYLWPPELGTGVVAGAVHHLTAGHPQATTLVLQDLQSAPELIDDLDTILSRPSTKPDLRVDGYLVDRVITGLNSSRRTDPRFLDDLITLSAARDRDEAEGLTGLLSIPVSVDASLLASTTLWSAPGPRRYPAMSPFVRYLLLRRLAARPPSHRACWDGVFGTLLRQTPETDLDGRLHHRIALGACTEVAGTLAGLLPTMPGDEWLALLDHAVATPDPRRPAGPDPEDEEQDQMNDGESSGPGEASSLHRSVLQLITQLQRLRDRRLGNRAGQSYCCLLVAHEYGQLAGKSRGGRRFFIDRAQEYRRTSEALA